MNGCEITGMLLRTDTSLFSGFERFLDRFGCFRFGGEADHQLAATKGNPFLVEAVVGLLAFFTTSI